MSLNVHPTGASLAGNCVFRGAVAPVDGDALVQTGIEAGGALAVEICDTADSANFIGIFNSKQFYGYGYASPDGRGIAPITNGRCAAKVREGVVEGDRLVTSTDGYLIPDTGAYSAYTHHVAVALESTGSTAGLYQVELLGLTL